MMDSNGFFVCNLINSMAYMSIVRTYNNDLQMCALIKGFVIMMSNDDNTI